MTGSDQAAHGRRSQPSLLLPQAQLTATARELAAAYAGVFSLQTVERYVFESYAALRRTAVVDLHLTALARRFAADRLRPSPRPRASWPRRCRKCCSSASTTPAARRWPRRCSPSTPTGGSMSAQPGRCPATRSTRP